MKKLWMQMLILMLVLCSWAPLSFAATMVYSSDGKYVVTNRSLAALATAPDCAGRKIVFTTDQTLTGNLNWPADRELVPENGAKINHGSYSISYAGSTDRWPLAQIFNGTGAVSGIKRPNVFWFGAKGDDSTDDNTAFTKAFAALPAYGELVAPEGYTYKFSSQLDLLNVPRGAFINIGGVLKFYGDIFGVTINGFQFKVRFQNTLSVNNSTKTGLRIKSVRVSEIYTGNVENFRVAVNAIGKYAFNGVNGTASNDITLGMLTTPQTDGICVLITADLQDSAAAWDASTNKYGYVNENWWRLNYMSGKYGIVFQPAGPATVVNGIETYPQMINGERFSGNKFLYPHFEDFPTDGIGMILDYTTHTAVTWPRFEGGSNPLYWVQEKSNCSRNIFMINDGPSASKLDLQGILRQEIGTQTVAGDVISQMMFGRNVNTGGTYGEYDVYVNNSRRLSGMKPGTFYFDPNVGSQRLFDVWAGGVTDLDGNERLFGLLDPIGRYTGVVSGDVVMPKGISIIDVETTGASSAYLVMPKSKEIAGFSCLLNVSTYTQLLGVKRSDLGIDISASAGNIKSAGLYVLAFTTKWTAVRIGEPLTSNKVGSAVYDPPILSNGVGVTTTLAVTGAAVGDFADISFSNDLTGVIMTAYVSAADTVSVRFQNGTGADVNLASGTLRARVRKP